MSFRGFFHRHDRRRSEGTTETAIAARQLEQIAEDEDRLPQRPVQWLVLMVLAALVGSLTGLVAGAFRLALMEMDVHRTAMVAWSHMHGTAWIMWATPVCLCTAGAAAACYLTQRFAPQTAGSGIPRVEAVVRMHLRPAGALTLPLKFVGGVLGIGSGLALGREGPTVQMGGTIGRLIGDVMERYVREPWSLIAAGAGAGLAAAFNAPLAAVIFVAEELLHKFSARVFSATLMAAICGTVVLRLMLGDSAEFASPGLTTLPATVLPDYLLLGLAAGFLGTGFNVCLMRTLSMFERAASWPRGAKGALVGAVVGLLAWSWPWLVGGGSSLAQSAIVNSMALRVGLAVLSLRFLLTVASYGTGAPGGIFAPLLALGAILGNAFAGVESSLTHHVVAPAPFAIVAMAACFTAVVRSPLTGVVLLLEMTGSWPLILPMMAASVTAYAVPELMGNPPIYESLRQRDERIEHAAAQINPAAGQVTPAPAR